MPPEPTPDTRRLIVQAAERLLHERGLAGATTRAIAEGAGCAEGSIYRYFPDKYALIMQVIKNAYPQWEVVQTLPERAGTRTVRVNLEEVALAALPFYRAVLPTMAGAIADPKMRDEQRRHFEAAAHGPMKSINAVTEYFRREQELGRVTRRFQPQYLTRLFLGPWIGQVLIEEMVGPGRATLGSDEAFVRTTVAGLLEGIGLGDRPRRVRPHAPVAARPAAPTGRSGPG